MSQEIGTRWEREEEKLLNVCKRGQKKRQTASKTGTVWLIQLLHLGEEHDLCWRYKSIPKLVDVELPQTLKLPKCLKTQVKQMKETRICSLLSNLLLKILTITAKASSGHNKRDLQCSLIWMLRFWYPRTRLAFSAHSCIRIYFLNKLSALWHTKALENISPDKFKHLARIYKSQISTKILIFFL